MRIALLLAIALAVSGCAKKSKPAAAPAAPAATTPAAESAPGGAPADDKKPGDPCDGGESKKQ